MENLTRFRLNHMPTRQELKQQEFHASSSRCHVSCRAETPPHRKLLFTSQFSLEDATWAKLPFLHGSVNLLLLQTTNSNYSPTLPLCGNGFLTQLKIEFEISNCVCFFNELSWTQLNAAVDLAQKCKSVHFRNGDINQSRQYRSSLVTWGAVPCIALTTSSFSADCSL